MGIALIFGIHGQDGGYLAEFLLEKNYRVIGVARRTSLPNDERIKHLYDNPNFSVVNADVTDMGSIIRTIQIAISYLNPDPTSKKDRFIEIYNLAAQSHVKLSFDEPLHTFDVTAKGCINILEAIRISGFQKNIRFYQASSSEMFGDSWSYMTTENGIQHRSGEVDLGGSIDSYDDNGNQTENVDLNKCAFQNEKTPFNPKSPYAIAKLMAHQAVGLYRKSYGMYAVSGILFNHESPRRGEQFVTRKITRYVAQCYGALYQSCPFPAKLKLGNLYASRDWGHSRDFVEAMWLMLHQEEGFIQDFVISTGETHTVREFLFKAFKVIGFNEQQAGSFVETDYSLFRPSEVPYLRGESSRANIILDWRPKISFDKLVEEMVVSDINQVIAPYKFAPSDGIVKNPIETEKQPDGSYFGEFHC